MARAAKATTPAAPKTPKRAVSEEIIRRFLKEGQTIYWAREMPTWYRLWKLYPSEPFWRAYELPFGGGTHSLNMMTWFESPEGKEDLERAWLLFHYEMPPLGGPSDSQIPVDSAPQGGYDRGIDDTSQDHYPKLPPRKPRSIAELLCSR